MNSSENHETATSITNSDRLQLDELREQELQINREQQGFSLCNRAFILRAMALLLGPLLSSIFMFDILQPGKPEISRTAAVTIWVAVWWIFEPVPMAVTAFLPFLLFPLVGVTDSKTMGAAYFNDLIFLFIGSYFIAIALEKWHLHKRFALLVLLRIGQRPKVILLGFMVIAWFLSMWLSNTCTAATLLPMANAILVNLRAASSQHNAAEESADVTSAMNKEDLAYSKAVILGIVYSCSIGGISTLIGTPTNLVFASTIGDNFPKFGNFPFITWQLYCTPLSAIFLILTWLLFVLIYVRKYKFDKRTDQQQQAELVAAEEDASPSRPVTAAPLSPMQVFQNEYDKLGAIKFEEVLLTCLFVLMSVLWITRELPFETGKNYKYGWAVLLFWYYDPAKSKYIGDGSVAIFIAVILFVIPSKSRPGESLLDWKFVAKKFPWNVLMLLGSGYALAKAFSVSKFGDFLALGIAKMAPHLNAYVLLFIISTAVTFFTEVSSNVAIASILLPVLAKLAVQVNQNPLFLMIPATLCCSFAFMLPVATPPNSIGFSYGYLKIRDMAVIGFFLNWIGIALVIFWQFALGWALDIRPNTIPTWANNTMT